MKIKVDTKDLKNVMTLLSYVVPKKSMNPTMGHVQIAGHIPDRVVFSVFDHDATLTMTMTGECESPGSSTANAQSLSELIKNLPSGPAVTLKILDGQKIQVLQSKSKYSFNSLDPSSFPEFKYPNPENFSTLNTEALCDAIEKVENCIATEEYRPALAGIYFEPTKEDGFVRAVASDGNKLMSCKFPGVISGPFTISKKGVTLIKKILSKVDECGIYLDDQTAHFHFTGGLLSIRMLNRTFPDYKQIIPRGTCEVVVLPKEDIVNALRRTLLFVESNRKSVDIVVSPESFDITTSNQEGSGSESLPTVESSDIKTSFSQSLNGEFLLNMIEKLSGENISIRHYGNNQPLIIHSDASTLGLLMPLRK